MSKMRSIMIQAAGLLVALTTSVAAQSDYPNRPVRLIIPFPPGGSNDVVGRMIGTQLSEQLGKQVVVDNRAGAGGVVGTEIVTKAPPDGYTLGVISLAHAVNPWLYKLPYDPIKAVTPIGIMGTGPNVLVVHPSLPVKTTQELIALAKSKPGDLQYASAGIGSFQHLGSELFKLTAKVDILHVPFKGGGPAMTDVLGGHTKIMFSSLVQTTPHIKSGKLLALGTGGVEAQRRAARHSDHLGRPAGLSGRELVGHHRAGRHAAGDRQAAARRAFRRTEFGGGDEAVLQRRRVSGADVFGGVRQVHGERNEQVGARRQGRRHQG